MSDLVGGSYQTYDPFWAALGRTANSSQGNIAARSNLQILGVGGLVEASLTTKKTFVAAVPVSWGDIITSVNVPITGTEGASGSETWVCIYTGAALGKKSTLIAQGAKVTGAVTKEALFTQALEKSVLITPTNAPNGYVYAGITTIEGTTVATGAVWKVKPKAVSYATGAPVWAAEFSQKGAGENAAEFTVAGSETVPFVILT